MARRRAPPHLHAAQPRRRGVLRPDCCSRGGSMRRAAALRAERWCSRRSSSTRSPRSMLVPTMIYVLLDHPKLDDDRPVEPADRLLRRVADVADPAAGGDPADRARSSSSSTARPSARMAITSLRKEDHDPDDLARLATLRPAGPVGAGGAARRRRQRGADGRAGRDLRAGPAGDGGLLEEAGARPRRRSPAAGCTPATSPARTSTASSRSSTARRT